MPHLRKDWHQTRHYSLAKLCEMCKEEPLSSKYEPAVLVQTIVLRVLPRCFPAPSHVGQTESALSSTLAGDRAQIEQGRSWKKEMGGVVFDDKVISSRQLIQSFSENLETVKIAWASDDGKVMILRVKLQEYPMLIKNIGELSGLGHLPLAGKFAWLNID